VVRGEGYVVSWMEVFGGDFEVKRKGKEVVEMWSDGAAFGDGEAAVLCGERC